MSTETGDNAGVIAPPPLIYAGGLALGLLLQQVAPKKLLVRTPRVIALTLGSTCISVALTIGALSVRQMRRANTNIPPTLPTIAIVTDGPFRFTRNPIYLSLTMLYMGIALLVNSLWLALLLPVILLLMTLGVIKREESYLERKFGPPYLVYKQRVRRWL